MLIEYPGLNQVMFTIDYLNDLCRIMLLIHKVVESSAKSLVSKYMLSH